LLMTERLTSSSLAGTGCTLVAVGTANEAFMFSAMRAAAPLSGVGTSSLAAAGGGAADGGATGEKPPPSLPPTPTDGLGPAAAGTAAPVAWPEVAGGAPADPTAAGAPAEPAAAPAARSAEPAGGAGAPADAAGGADAAVGGEDDEGFSSASPSTAGTTASATAAEERDKDR
jgi:hypothetical protein